MLQTICNDIGKIMLEGCANAGRMMLLFTDTLKRISKADGKETVRQMAKLGADSLPIVMMTILLQVWFFLYRQRRNLYVLVLLPQLAVLSPLRWGANWYRS